MAAHGKTDSEVTSLDTSSPARSAYYVQSPSRDSEKTTNSFHSTPGASPIGSPPHSNSTSSLERHSSSSTRFSRKTSKPWKSFSPIEEESLLDHRPPSTRSLRCYLLSFLLLFIALFSLFSLILWGASRSQDPQIQLNSISFLHFVLQAGSDFSGVATDMMTMNSSVKLTFRNTATFFGLHVTSSPLDLSYSQLTVATGTINEFYQSRKSQRRIEVTVRGSGIPLYGGGATLGDAASSTVPLNLSFVVRCRAYVLGRLVKPKFYKEVECDVFMNPRRMNTPISLKNSCHYK